MLGVGAALAGGGVTVGVTYYFTPKYTRVGYEPVQPVPFSHKIHAGQLGLDCRYCHNGVEKSWFCQSARRLHLHELPQPDFEG